jgi:hypothetical protein
MAKLKNLERLSYPELVKEVGKVETMTKQESTLVAQFLMGQWRKKTDFQNDVVEGLEVVRTELAKRKVKKPSIKKEKAVK